MELIEYCYELRRDGEIVATGRLVRRRFEVGERVAIGADFGIVRSVDPILGEREQRLVIELIGADSDAA